MLSGSWTATEGRWRATGMIPGESSFPAPESWRTALEQSIPYGTAGTTMTARAGCTTGTAGTTIRRPDVLNADWQMDENAGLLQVLQHRLLLKL